MQLTIQQVASQYKAETNQNAYIYYADGSVSGFTVEFVKWLLEQVQNEKL